MQSLLIGAYRAMKPGEKLARVRQLKATVMQLAAARIIEQYGNMPEHELRLRLASLWIDRRTMIRAYGWDPELRER